MTTVGLVGCGNWGRNILRDLVAIGVRVHVADPDDSARSAAIAAGAVSVVGHHGDLPDCDAVVVAVPIASTGGVVLELMGRAIPLFVEKPLAHSAHLAREIVQCEGGPVFVMDKWRYHPAVETVRCLIRDGALGQVESIRLERWGWWESPRDHSSLWWLAPHDLSIALHWIGTLPPSVAAHRLVQRGTDDVLAVMEEPGGPTVTVDIRTSSPVHRRSFTVVGTRSTVHLPDADSDHLVVRESGAQGRQAERRLPLAGTLPLEAELRHFIDYLSGGPAPLSSAQDGLAVVERLSEIERRWLQ